MEFVQPIRSKQKINAIKKILAASPRDSLLFTLGINSGLRIGDILRMRMGDVVDGKGQPRAFYELRERKTGKAKRIPLSSNVQRSIRGLLQTTDMDDPDDYLFRSRKGPNRPISRQQAWHILNQAARMVGLQERIGTHTLRKTFGYHAYKKGTDITILQSLFNHSAPSVTLRYIGITQDDMDKVVLDLNL
jgi:integrase